MNSNNKINILVIPDLFPKFKGDVQGIFILDYLTSTAPHCNNTVLFGRLTSETQITQHEITDNYELYRFSMSNKKIKPFLKPIYYILWFKKGYKIGKSIKNIDLIHAHGSILSGTLSYLLSKKLKVPFIITEHQGPFTMTSESFWKRNWTSYIMRKADAVLTVSNHLKQEILKANIIPKQILVTHNPVDTDLFGLKKLNLNKTFLFVGRLDNFKGALRCLKAFDLIHDKIPDWKYTIVGDGEDNNAIINYLNSKPKLKQKVKLTGQLSKSEISKELQHSDFLVFPSKHESFGLVITEALSSGLPVIVGNTTAPIEFVNPQNGILIQYDDIDAISKSIEIMISKLNNYDSQVIRNEIISKFGFKSFGEKMHNIYNSFIKKS